MKKVLVIGLLACFCSSAFAGPTSSRNTSTYYLGGYALHTVTTNPVQAFQPVYSWRTHVKFDGTPGPLGYNATFIGTTNANGILNIVVPNLPYDPIYCGFFLAERVAVGSPSAPKSNPLSFSIQSSLIGPRPPFFNECRIGNDNDNGGGGGPIDPGDPSNPID